MRRLQGVRVLLLAFLLGQSFLVASQQKPLLVVGQDTVPEAVFRYAYEKNRTYTLTAGLTVREFLKSYRGFRLKVAEAKRQGLDTLRGLRSEYDKYVRFQLASRLLDSAARESQYRDAYARMQREVAASHILIRVGEDEDTLRAYERIVSLRNRALSGEPFDLLAREYSEDPSARENGGYLGYFGAFSMVAPFERMAYATAVDSISPPVRTSFGYHIIRVHGVRAARGKMRVAHIMKVVRLTADSAFKAAVRERLDSVREAVLRGADFGSVAATESEDSGSAQQGGILPWITPERFPAEFVEACFALAADGEVSPVVQTLFGMHIIQRLDYEPVPSYAEAKEQIRSHFAREGMILEGEHALRNALERRVKMRLHRNAIAMHGEQTLRGGDMPDSIGDVVLMECTGVSLTGHGLTNWLRARGMLDSLQGQQGYIRALQQAVNELVEGAALRLEESEDPELGYMLDEFYDGLLLFEISDREVWSRPLPDTLTLREVYARHRKSLKFPVCYQVERYTSSSDTVLRRVRALLAAGGALEGLGGGFRVESRRCGADDWLLDGQTGMESWPGGLSSVQRGKDGGFMLLRILGTWKNEAKTFDEARGDLYALYQADQESAWLKRLAKRHRVWVNRSRIRALEKDYGQ